VCCSGAAAAGASPVKVSFTTRGGRRSSLPHVLVRHADLQHTGGARARPDGDGGADSARGGSI
jgi:hypothetical protein